MIPETSYYNFICVQVFYRHFWGFWHAYCEHAQLVQYSSAWCKDLYSIAVLEIQPFIHEFCAESHWCMVKGRLKYRYLLHVVIVDWRYNSVHLLFSLSSPSPVDISGNIEFVFHCRLASYNAPINVMPHYPPYGQHTGHTGGFFKKSVPHTGGFDIPHHRTSWPRPHIVS